jgi:hypothetical protein
MQWLKITEGQTVNAAIDLASIKTIVKHWTGQRSELCLGQGCPLCLAGIAKRWRYQASTIVDRTPYQWEFGEQVHAALQNIPHETSWAYITITRTGEGRNTSYDIASRLADQPTRAPSYQELARQLSDSIIRRKYGNSAYDPETEEAEGQGLPYQEL